MLEVVAGIISGNDGKILIAQRGKDMGFEGKWEFPGGKVKDGEEFRSALKREIKEELELDINVGEKVYQWTFEYDFGPINFTAYSAKIIGGTLNTLEHMDAKWVAPEELGNYEMVPADVELAGILKGRTYEL